MCAVCFHVCLLSRCFGLLLSPGKNVKNSDMHLLDLVGDCFRVCVSLSVWVCLLTSSNLCPSRSRWERVPMGSLTSSQEVGTQTRLSSSLWMRKRPKVTANNLSKFTYNQMIVNSYYFIGSYFVCGLFIHTYFHTNLWHISKCEIPFALVPQIKLWRSNLPFNYSYTY